jgi:hypothetical protein
MGCEYSFKLYERDACRLVSDAPWCRSNPEKCEIYKFRGLVDEVYEQLEEAVPDIIICQVKRAR